jgi:hypothetical protein
LKPYTDYGELPTADLDTRAALVIEGIRRSVARRTGAPPNQANVRHMEAFLAYIQSHFEAKNFEIQIQAIPQRRIRTTDRNFIVTVPGRSDDRIIMVAHYDTWAGFSSRAPGADDNSSGEEVLKHYLLRDLCAAEPPPLTHVYLFSGSEECGTRGLLSQFALVLGLYLVGYAISAASPGFMLLALLFFPFAIYRLGITGTRHFVDSLTAREKAAIRAAIAVDSVGEGRLYIPENEMGANFIRGLFPYEGSEALNELLEEGAHINGIKYNRYLAGGTTDSVAFLEERGPRLAARNGRRIPAAALLTMTPGKASPLVVGGKIHTRNDTADRIYPTPLKEVMTVLDYALDMLQAGPRAVCPRRLTEHHYARLYRKDEHLYIALKDAVEPNRRNINTVFRVRGTIEDRRARVTIRDVVGWGVETTLDKEMRDLRPGARRAKVNELVVTDPEGDEARFTAVIGIGRRARALVSGLTGRAERTLGRYSFLAIFGASFLIGYASNLALDGLFALHPTVTRLLIGHLNWVFALFFLLQIALLLRFISRELPAAMDNAYRHLNQADNLMSLRRAPHGGGAGDDGSGA